MSLALLCRTFIKCLFSMYLKTRPTLAGGGRSSSPGGPCPPVRTAPRRVTAASRGLMFSCPKPDTLKNCRLTAALRPPSFLKVILKRARLGGWSCSTGKYYYYNHRYILDIKIQDGQWRGRGNGAWAGGGVSHHRIQEWVERMKTKKNVLNNYSRKCCLWPASLRRVRWVYNTHLGDIDCYLQFSLWT